MTPASRTHHATATLTALLMGCSGGMASPDTPSPPAGDTPGKPNFLLVSMDTCRYDHTGLGGYGRDTTPNLDRLAQQGVSFTHAYAQSNETLYSHAAIFTATYPGDLATLDDDFHLPSDAHTLAEVLALYDYDTAGFTGGAHMTSALGMGRGFEIYRDDIHFGSFFQSVQLASAWLEQPHDDPFFLFVHGYDCHSPYVKPLFFDHLFDPDYAGIADEIIPLRDGVERIHNGRFYDQLRPSFVATDNGRRYVSDDFFLEALPRAAAEHQHSMPLTPRDLEHMVAHYDGGMVYADLYLGLLLASLEERGLADDTIVMVFSDHGEGLTDYGHFQHRPHLRENVIRVPLVIAGPDRFLPVGRRIDSFVRSIDIAPTVLDLADVPPLQGVPGQSLSPLLSATGSADGAPVFSQSRHQVSVRVPGEQLILDKVALSPEAALDPVAEHIGYHTFEGERPAGTQPVGARALELRLRAWVEGLSPTAELGPGMDDELREALRERGYW